MTQFLRKLQLLLRRDRFQSDLAEEMAFHRDEAEAGFVAGGMSPEAARKAAQREFGNELKLRQQSHEAIGFRLESLWLDARYAVRQMLRSPGLTMTIVVTLALGIGANTAIFSVVQATLLRQLPYPKADRIVSITDKRIQGTSTGGLVTVPRFFDLQERNHSFDSVSSFYFDQPTLVAGTRLPQQIDSVNATSDFWRVMSVSAWMGRTFDARDDRPKVADVVVLSYAAWQRYLSSDPDVIGKVVQLDHQPTTIIGVMPENFHYPSQSDAGAYLWRPSHFDPANWKSYRGDGVRFTNLVARLKDNVTYSTARNELQLIGAQLATEHADTDAPWQFASMSIRDELYGNLRPALMVLLAASAVLLLIACLNVANLLLSRATARQREVALRQALGASRARIVRQLLTESVLLALLGGMVGLSSAYLLLAAASTKLPASMQVQGGIMMNWPVASFALGLSLIAGIVFGLAPAFVRGADDLNRSLKSGDTQIAGASRASMRSAFIAAQVGLSLMLLVVACLLVQSLWRLTRSPLGFTPDHVLTFKIDLPWGTTPAATDTFYDDVERRIESLPGVTAVGQISALPTESWHTRGNFDLEWKPRTAHHDTASAELRNLDGNYLGAMGIPLLAGRALRPGDNKVVLINQEFAQRYMPGGNPLGQHMLGGSNVQIVGVIGNVRGTSGSIAAAVEPEVYYSSSGITHRSFAVRTRLAPGSLIAVIRNQVRQVDPQQAVGSVRTLDAMLRKDTAQPRLNLALVVSFAAIALLLACVGIYGVVAYSVAQRRQEIGVRMALGSTRGQITQLFLRRTLLSATIGLTGGAAGSLLLTRLLRNQLYGISPNDPRTFGIAILLLLVPVFLASLRPALRAASVNPMEALRTE